MKLFSYWRSGTSYRVRIALALKGETLDIVPVNLLEGAHRESAFLERNPQGLVPTLELDDGTLLSQSPAIIEYLDEVLPGPKLLPEDPLERAKVRHLAAIIGCDTHPLQNLRILKYLQDPLGHDREKSFAWAAHWIDTGLGALEAQVPEGSAFTCGEQPGLVECYLIPQLYAGRRFGADLAALPKLTAIEERTLAWPGLADAHPDNQPDAQTSVG
ncbi:MAG: maleylacetoacetate isomerase [Pseudomonadota bacterium]